MVPLFGDIARNHVRYYDPPEDFEENWLKPLPSYQDGESIAKNYRLNDYVPQKGELILTDFSSLHASVREKNCGPRISIDTTFALKRTHRRGIKEIIHPWRENERISHQLLSSIGETHIFSFPDSVDQKVDCQGGFKHPTNLHIKEII